MRKKMIIIILLVVLLLAVIIIFPNLYLRNTDDIEEKIGTKEIYTIADLIKYSYLEFTEPAVNFICSIEDTFTIDNNLCHITVQSEEEKEYLISCYLGENEIQTTNLISNAEFDVELNEGNNSIKIEVKDGTNVVKTWKKEIAYIVSYEEQFLDEYGKSGLAVHLIRTDDNNQENNIALLKSLGIQYIRIEIRWEKVEKNGAFHFEQYDEYMKKIEESGLQPIVILGAPGNLIGTDKIVSSEDELKRYVEYAVAVCNQYPFVQYYEIWNEPNFLYNNEDGIQWYTKMTNEVSKSLKAINENISIIAGSTVLTGSTDFIQKISEKGTLLTSDSYSYHPYDISHTEKLNSAFSNFISQHYQLKNDLGGFQHFDITEFGLSTNTKDNVDEEEQAIREVQQSIMSNEYNIQKNIIYHFRDTGEEDSRQQSFGIVQNDYTPKPAYYALKNYNENTNGAEYIGRVNLEDGLDSYVYNKDGKPKIITWSSNTGSNITINYQNFTAKDLYGNNIENEDGTLTITNSPVYLDNISDRYFYEAISNTATEKYTEFEEKFAEQINKIEGLTEKIAELKTDMMNIADNEAETQANAIKQMSEHFALGDTLLNAYKNGILDVEYVTLSSMLDMLNDIGNSYEDLVTVSATTREGYLEATNSLIQQVENEINNNSDLEIVYPTKILNFAKELDEKAEYILSLEEENDIKTGLIVSNSLHAYYLANWANLFTDIYINDDIKNNPVTVAYSETELTNKNVIATLNVPQGTTITNNEGKNTHVFEQNDKFTFEYERRGQAFTLEVQVSNIDKEAPTITGVMNGKIYVGKVSFAVNDDYLENLEVTFNDTLMEYHNGQELMEEGIYRVIAVDKAGNITELEFYIVTEITDDYIIKDNYLLNIKPNTNITDFIAKFAIIGEYQITRNNEQVSQNEVIATGDILKLENGQEYTIIVTGDINKDGKVTVFDYTTLRRTILRLRELDEIETLAADINLDNSPIGVKDYTRMRIELLGEY